MKWAHMESWMQLDWIMTKCLSHSFCNRLYHLNFVFHFFQSDLFIQSCLFVCLYCCFILFTLILIECLFIFVFVCWQSSKKVLVKLVNKKLTETVWKRCRNKMRRTIFGWLAVKANFSVTIERGFRRPARQADGKKKGDDRQSSSFSFFFQIQKSKNSTNKQNNTIKNRAKILGFQRLIYWKMNSPKKCIAHAHNSNNRLLHTQRRDRSTLQNHSHNNNKRETKIWQMLHSHQKETMKKGVFCSVCFFDRRQIRNLFVNWKKGEKKVVVDRTAATHRSDLRRAQRRARRKSAAIG